MSGVEALLLDDDAALRQLAEVPRESLERRVTVPSAFTSCEGVTLLHVCAEFNSVRCARVRLTPVSYAQCGLYTQFHRDERDVYSNLTHLYRRLHGAELPIRNVPNKYLTPRS